MNNSETSNLLRLLFLSVLLGISILCSHAQTQKNYFLVCLADNNSFKVAEGTDYDNLKWGFIDRTGKEIIAPKYEWPVVYNGDYAEVRLNQKSGVIDRNGKHILPCKYDNVNLFEDGIAIAKTGSVAHIINLGTLETLCTIDDRKSHLNPLSYSEGLILAQNLSNDNFKFLNLDGTTAIPKEFEQANGFHEGLAGVVINDRITYINKTGSKAFNRDFYLPSYDDDFDGREISDFKDGYAVVADTIYSEEFDDMIVYQGIIDKEGNQILPCKYDFLELDDKGNILLWTTNEDDSVNYQYITPAGKVIKSVTLPENTLNYDPVTGIYILSEYNDAKERYIFTIYNSDGPMFEGTKFEDVEESGFYQNSGCTYVKFPGDERWSIVDAKGNTIFRNISLVIPRDIYPC